MLTALRELRLGTTDPIQVVDISAQVRALLRESGIREGLLTLISSHTTAFVSLNESEPRLHEDMVDFLKRIAPREAGYRHDVSPVDDRHNAHSHLVGLFMSASQCIPIVAGELLLGAWQAILFVELDGPRACRTLQVQILGAG